MRLLGPFIILLRGFELCELAQKLDRLAKLRSSMLHESFSECTWREVCISSLVFMADRTQLGVIVLKYKYSSESYKLQTFLVISTEKLDDSRIGNHCSPHRRPATEDITGNC